MGDIYIVTARAKDRTGREDESTGAVALGNLKGDALCNALMKGETKAKRRVTLSIAGLGWLDETELATIPGVHTDAPDAAHETTGISHPLPVGEDGTPCAATPPHPTAEDITTLVNSARAANVDLEAFGHDMRRLMQLPERQKITKKFLRETMTMAQYNTARAHYGEALRQVLNSAVVICHAETPMLPLDHAKSADQDKGVCDGIADCCPGSHRHCARSGISRSV